MRATIRGATVVALCASSLVLASSACFSERATGAERVPSGALSGCRVPVTPGDGAVQGLVGIRAFTFIPDTIRIARGTTVTWVNCDEGGGDPPHTTTSDANLWTSDLLPAAATFSRRFDDAGTFGYHCAPHPFMKAVVIVE